MDFPLDLRTKKYVRGLAEFRQDLELVLKNTVGTFIQSRLVGSMIPEHGPENLVEFGIQETIKNFPNTTLEACNISHDTDGSTLVDITVKYGDEFENFKFTI